MQEHDRFALTASRSVFGDRSSFVIVLEDRRMKVVASDLMDIPDGMTQEAFIEEYNRRVGSLVSGIVKHAERMVRQEREDSVI